jgi:hypothetical protein
MTAVSNTFYIVLPIAALVGLFGWLGMVYWAAAHPQWRSQRTAVRRAAAAGTTGPLAGSGTTGALAGSGAAASGRESTGRESTGRAAQPPPPRPRHAA